MRELEHRLRFAEAFVHLRPNGSDFSLEFRIESTHRFGHSAYVSPDFFARDVEVPPHLGDRLLDGFDRHIFIEQRKDRCRELELLKDEFPERGSDCRDDLFLTDVEHLLDHMVRLMEASPDRLRRLVPLRELLGHISDVEDFYRAIEASSSIAGVLDLVEAYFVRLIDHRIRSSPVSGSLSSDSRRLVATSQARAAMSFVEEWVSGSTTQEPARLDALFHRMAWSAIDAATTP